MPLKIFSQISSIIVALLFVYTINFKSFVTVSYFVNQAEIIDLFCVNKEKPILQCNGKCHLANQLAEVENNTEDAPFSSSSLSYNLEINLSLVDNEIDFLANVDELKKSKSFTKNAIPCDGFSAITSPPPKA